MAFDITRRFFLRGAAVTAPLLAVPAAAAVGSYAEENPVLLDLGFQIEEAEREIVAAGASYDDALSIGRRLWPRAPEELRESYGGLDSDLERDIRGAGFRWPEDETRRYVRSLDGHRKAWNYASSARGPGSKKHRAHFSHRLALAEEYAAKKDHAREVSGFTIADIRFDAATAEVERLGHEIHRAEAFTMAGVAVKAKAIRAWGRAPAWKRLCALDGRDEWAPALAASLLATLEASDTSSAGHQK